LRCRGSKARRDNAAGGPLLVFAFTQRESSAERSARACYATKAIAAAPTSARSQSPTRRSPLGWRSRFRFHLGGFPDRTFPINGEEKPGSFVAGRLLSVDDLTHAFNGKHKSEARSDWSPFALPSL
jgi:hypothetical protein